MHEYKCVTITGCHRGQRWRGFHRQGSWAAGVGSLDLSPRLCWSSGQMLPSPHLNTHTSGCVIAKTISCLVAYKKLNSNCSDNWLITILKAKMPNGLWFQLLYWRNLLLFLVLYDSNLKIHGKWHYEDMTMGSSKLWWTYVDVFWSLIDKTINQLIIIVRLTDDKNNS